MNGVHDMGGMHGFGPIQREQNEPIFHEPWERTVYGMAQSVRAQGAYNIDESRHGIERMPPAQYLSASYYERWLASLERNLVEKGLITLEEIDARAELFHENPSTEVPERYDPELAERIGARIRSRPTAYERPATTDARFAVGEAVLARNLNPTGHTRLPRYARGRRGTIARVHGVYVLPDTAAHGRGENPEWLYSVAFDGRELWGGAAEPNQTVYLDLWESYLEEGAR